MAVREIRKNRIRFVNDEVTVVTNNENNNYYGNFIYRGNFNFYMKPQLLMCSLLRYTQTFNNSLRINYIFRHNI